MKQRSPEPGPGEIFRKGQFAFQQGKTGARTVKLDQSSLDAISWIRATN
jgi:hypothetical protein